MKLVGTMGLEGLRLLDVNETTLESSVSTGRLYITPSDLTDPGDIIDGSASTSEVSEYLNSCPLVTSRPSIPVQSMRALPESLDRK